MGIHLALLQTDIKFCDFEYNAAHVKEMIADAMEKVPRPDVIVLPEDWSSGFSDEMFHHMEEHIEQIDGPSVTVLRECAKQYSVWIVAGSVGIRSEDGMRNTTFLINREGEIVGDYSKMHLYSDMDEDVPYLHGTKTEVYDTELGRVGFMICYDIRFCELSRAKGSGAAHRHFEFSKSPCKSLEDAADCQGDRKPDVCCSLQPCRGKSHGNLLRPFHHHRSMGECYR